MDESARSAAQHSLAMHETLELHELLAMKSNRLAQDKRTVAKITDPQLRDMYLTCIQVTTKQIQELAALLEQYSIQRRS
ncbi:hypothetical protein Alches_03250 [Alicyclobacillus hesperidum subsp. aegles]|uniref:hypothetical protein n=1 Tax=Alicyclobacillus hesperidum TaxID=89784 RepID=UPI0007192199|nr:hypothetical protein [Alicyclobacillus hesperidum]GLG00286.1 hypothetical protein Alches_03250 [Alicyclobacillus hesperidum subsp. aegles]